MTRRGSGVLALGALLLSSCGTLVRRHDHSGNPIYAQSSFPTGSFDDAVASYTDELRRNPRQAEVYRDRGYAFYLMGAYRKAVRDFTRAIRLNPRDAVVWTYRGEARTKLTDYTGAIADFDIAIRLKPRDPQAHTNQGVAYACKGDYDRAIKKFNESINLDPSNAINYNDRGEAYAELGSRRQAVRDFTTAIRLNRKYTSAYCNRGATYKEMGRYGDAIADYQRAIEIDLHRFDAYNNLAWVFATCPVNRFRNGGQAVKLALTACRLSQWSQPAEFNTLAAAYAEAGNYEEAIKWQNAYLRAIRDWPVQQARGRLQLALYRRNKPYREPIGDHNSISVLR